jgi:hypothetical protein
VRPERHRRLPLLTWLRSAVAVLIMAGSLIYGLPLVGRGLLHLPDAVRRGDLLSALGVMLLVTLCAALFSVGAGLWSRSRSPRPGAGAAWQRAFQMSCVLAVGLMLLILTAGILPKL